MKDLLLYKQAAINQQDLLWYKVGQAQDFPTNGGVCIKYKDLQIAVFNFSRMNKWYACQNLCPHKMEMVLSRGMIGDEAGIPKVACPMHKHNFSLENGQCLTAELPPVTTFPVEVRDGNVFVGFYY